MKYLCTSIASFWLGTHSSLVSCHFPVVSKPKGKAPWGCLFWLNYFGVVVGPSVHFQIARDRGSINYSLLSEYSRVPVPTYFSRFIPLVSSVNNLRSKITRGRSLVRPLKINMWVSSSSACTMHKKRQTPFNTVYNG